MNPFAQTLSRVVGLWTAEAVPTLPEKWSSSPWCLNLTHEEDPEKNRVLVLPCRQHAIIHLALLGRLPYGDRLEDCLEEAREICEKLVKGTYQGCYFDLFLNNGKIEVEIEPGMGTTVARMVLSDQRSAFEVIMGLLCMLSVQKGDKEPYLIRNKSHTR